MGNNKKGQATPVERSGLDNHLIERALDLPTKESAPSYGFGSAHRHNVKLFVSKDLAMSNMGEFSPGPEIQKLFPHPFCVNLESRVGEFVR